MIVTKPSAFRNKKMEIKRELDKYNVLEITKNVPRKMNQRYLLSTLEVGVVVLGCVVFVGTLITALCVTCVRRNKRYKLINDIILVQQNCIFFKSI